MSLPRPLALVALFALAASRLAAEPALPVFRPVTARQAAFLGAVDNWSALLPPDPQGAVAKRARELEKIKEDASTKEAARALDPIEKRFEDWKTAFLRDLYSRTHYDFFSDPRRFETYMQERLSAAIELQRRSKSTVNAAKLETYDELEVRVGDTPDGGMLDYIYDKLGLRRNKTLEFGGKEQASAGAASNAKVVFSPPKIVRPEELAPPPSPGGGFKGKGSPAYERMKEHLTAKGVRADVIDLVFDEAQAQGADPLLVLAVIKAESYFNPRATSPSNARGLMQLMDFTAKQFGVSNPEVNSYVPALNVKGGIKVLRYLWDKFAPDFNFSDLSSQDAWTRDEVKRVIASYNAGPGNAYRWTKIKETSDYVPKVLGFYEDFKKVAASEA